MEGFAWPIAVVLIVVVVILVFKPQIGGFISRLKSVSRSGLEAETYSQTSATTTDSSAAEKLLRESDSALVSEQEKVISEELEKRNLHGVDDRARYLLRQLTVCMILRAFDYTYSLIYGSQIIALQQLNGRVDMTLDDLRPMYDFAAAAYSERYQNFSYEDWFGFLTQSRLVLEDGEYVRITVRGREFLRWLMAAGLNVSKTG